MLILQYTHTSSFNYANFFCTFVRLLFFIDYNQLTDL